MARKKQNRQQQAIDALYREAVDLADHARRWFDGPGVAWRKALPVDAQAAVAIESLGTTARLMAVMAWLLDPAQSASAGAAKPGGLVAADEGELSSESPLAGTPGGEIAAATRRLVAKVAAMVPPPPPDSPLPDAAPSPAADAGLWRT